jgi:glycosyltransferase involved in cell wall biosynthesis
MVIGFDAKRAFFNKSGLGNYSRSLISGLRQFYPDNQYLLYAPKVSKDFFFGGENVKTIIPANVHSYFPSLWRSYGINSNFKEDKPDIYHGLSNELPLIRNQRIKKVVTIHDLIFLRFPNLYPFIDRNIYKLKTKSACKSADVIIATSEATKQDIIEFLDIPAEKISVQYQSCNNNFYTEVSESFKQKVKHKYKLPEKFFLCVGTVEERKNLLTVLEAMSILPKEFQLPLVVIGKKKKEYFARIMKYAEEKKLSSLLLFPESVSNEELPAFYSLSTLFIYPSVFEGFGIPVTEALLSKVPVITSNVSSLPEAAGSHSLLLQEPKNHEELAHHIQTVLSSQETQKTMAEKGWLFAQKFQPEVTSQNIMKLYLQLLG